MKKEYLVHYRCKEDSLDWGKKGATNKIKFKVYNKKLFEEVKPSNWEIERVEVLTIGEKSA
jgi:hypothetical protein